MGLMNDENTPHIYKGDKIVKKTSRHELDSEAAYGDHIKNTAAICNSSASHTYGNVMGIVEKHLVELFPKNLFNTVMASTTFASKQIRHLSNRMHKKDSPMMVLIPRISFGQGDNRFLSNTYFNSRPTNIHSMYGDGSLLELAVDSRKKIYIHGHYNRALMNIDVILNFDTYSEQINYMSHLHNMASIGHNKFLQAPLELYIPKDFCSLISDVSGIGTQQGNVSDLLTYMNTIWHHPITYKLKGGSNSDEFFMYYLADIDMVIQEPLANNGTRDGQLMKNFEISFTVKCEFNTIGYFTLNSPKLKKPSVIKSNDTNDVHVMFTDNINLNDFNLPVGWVILTWPIFKLAEGSNTISFNSVLNYSLNAVINHHLKHNIPMNRFIDIQFRENGEILDNELFYIDWINREIVLMEPNHRRTYRLIISVSNHYINELIKQLYDYE